MTDETLVTAREDSPFRRESAGRFRNRRVRVPDEINLKNCGLLDSRAAAVHRETLASFDPNDVLTYPILWPVYGMLADRFGVDVDSLVLTAGSDPGLNLLTRAFPEVSRIVLHQPNFDGWSKFAAISGCVLDPVAPDPGTGLFDLGDLARRLRAGAPAFVVVTTPHSFTGQVHGARELAELAAVVAEHGSLLVVDTAYLAFTEGGEELVRELAGLRHVVRVNTFSKSYGLSGARIAVTVAHPAVARHLFDLDPEGPVSALAVTLLRRSLEEQAVFTGIWADVRRLRERFAADVERAVPGWHARPSGGNFVTWDVPDRAAAGAASRYLLERGIVVRDLSGAPGLPAALRIAVANEAVARRVVAALGDWQRGEAA
ncbi:aminotransferase class I/II-fold pyridoxal phosphate-dependent enzyme [Streptomyces acidiscabies]|uniref:histidinol-phosphate transaminase n=1 Tax=Streptomyces acidiscabies TaxID=42234 RepID=A0AAP6B929_9ACTN|nr:aminotransferase class I/II-fold pyridoxal phosphate-dependent enzyme [Streptomyces acidiscabies]MBP5936046.1 histidinol-phosphate aminotransferase family protein [Streptomyces sp. LBUM 1476]MBZ3916027.1 histidinol-phosphate aminotransferase family protein [Streptomyces acidiscabies]MDX2960418.1 aminotransferase class I/II-fold pyridoxal phosphate-dependent enzyme [Streptomyces acidiscabies]MDX3017704.1 aminotransferase class I/II-fold pyridoxal phosphate-dependent enzyme [Streptomyces acidi